MSMESKGPRMCHPSMMLHLNTKQSLYITTPLSLIPHTIFLSKTKCVYCLKYLLQAISKPLGLMQTLWSLLALPVVSLLWELSVLPNQRWVYDLGWAKQRALCLSMVSALTVILSGMGSTRVQTQEFIQLDPICKTEDWAIYSSSQKCL